MKLVTMQPQYTVYWMQATNPCGCRLCHAGRSSMCHGLIDYKRIPETGKDWQYINCDAREKGFLQGKCDIADAYNE